MMLSMTAFSRAETTVENTHLVWELKSVNHRYLEATVRLPEELRSLETRVRERVGQRVGRGKVECSLRIRLTGPGSSQSGTRFGRVRSRLRRSGKRVRRPPCDRACRRAVSLLPLF